MISGMNKMVLLFLFHSKIIEIISITIILKASFLPIQLRQLLTNYAIPHKPMIMSTPIHKKLFFPSSLPIASAIESATPVPTDISALSLKETGNLTFDLTSDLLNSICTIGFPLNFINRSCLPKFHLSFLVRLSLSRFREHQFENALQTYQVY